MSSRSISVPRKISDAQYVGDLINLFERRKIPVGDASSFQTFESELTSNDLLRSGLFTLCTAISHMAEEDLSGEQLLALVARALAGPAVPKGAALDIPDSLRSVFLNGYEAWSNRGSVAEIRSFESKEPLAWPAPRPAARNEVDYRQDEFGFEPQPSASAPEPAAAKPPVPGVRTLQEALELAKTRFPSEPALPHPADMGAKGTNIEGLTLGELKQLLEDIQHRVARIQPQLREIDSRPPADFGRRERMREIDEAVASHTPEDGPPVVMHRSPSPSRLNEAAFLARHAYMRPTRRIVVEPTPIGPLAAPAATSTAPAAQIAASPTTFAAAATVAVPAAKPAAAVAQEPVTPVAEPAAVVTPQTGMVPARTFEPTVLPIAVPLLPRQYAEATEPLAQLRSAMITESATPRNGSIYFRIAGLKLGPRTVIGSLAAFIIITGGLGGILIYPSLHPTYFFSNSKLLPASSLTTDPTQSAPPVSDASSAAQVILAAPDEGALVPQPAQSPHAAATPGTKNRIKTPPPPPVSVWPSTSATPAIAVPAASLTGASTSQTPRRPTASSSAPVYVPSTTIIGYALTAPQPTYPRDQPKGIVGTVVLQLTISKDGDVTDIRTLSGPDQMRPATVQAVQAWHFRPYFVNGYPVEVTTTLGFLFRGQ